MSDLDRIIELAGLPRRPKAAVAPAPVIMESAPVAPTPTPVKNNSEFTAGFKEIFEALTKGDLDHTEVANSKNKGRTYPNDAFTFKSGGSQKNRYVQANHGDNPLVNADQIDEEFRANITQQINEEFTDISDSFVHGYIQGLFFTSTGDDEGEIPSSKGVSDFADTTITSIIDDCNRFVNRTGELLELAYDAGYSEEQAGIDFWLTRNGHGAGFWDRNVLEAGEIGDKLTKVAKEFGESDAYVGDDGLIYV